MTIASARIPDLGGYYYILQNLRSLTKHTIDLLERFGAENVDIGFAEPPNRRCLARRPADHGISENDQKTMLNRIGLSLSFRPQHTTARIAETIIVALNPVASSAIPMYRTIDA